MEFSLLALIIVTLLDEIGWHMQVLRDEEDAQAEVLADLAFEQWLSLHDYPDHW